MNSDSDSDKSKGPSVLAPVHSAWVGERESLCRLFRCSCVREFKNGEWPAGLAASVGQSKEGERESERERERDSVSCV